MGHKGCFEVLVRRHSAVLYRMARTFGFNKEDAERLVSETHLNAFQYIRKMRPRTSYRIWLISVMIHKCRNRTRTAETSSPGIAADPAGLAIRSSCHYERRHNNISVGNRLELQLDSMPAALRSVFVLHEVEGYDLRETARLLNTSEQSIKSIMDQAKARLRKISRGWYAHTDVYVLDEYSTERVICQVMDKVDHKLVKPVRLLTPRA